MSEEKKNINTEKNNKPDLGRRDLLKGLATVPVLGAFAYTAYRKSRYDKIAALESQTSQIKAEFDINSDEPPADTPVDPNGQKIRVGLIGYGIRGKQICQALGYVTPEMVDEMIAGEGRSTIEDFKAQENLNIEITAICDIFDTYAEMAQDMSANINREGTGGNMGTRAKRYLNHKDLIASPEVDAVIIAAPDHWHTPMAIEAARNGKHVYCEKPLSWSVEETYDVRKVVKDSGIVFQLGHQGRQTDSYNKAKEAYEKGLIGRVNLIEVTTNRNSANGAWVYDIDETANENTIDWEQFIGQAPWHDFSLQRFFRWRCWWDYSTGISGDLLTHEYDALNQILNLGIPSSAASTGGIYFFKDGRTVPDVLTTVFEYKRRNLSLLYSATLASAMSRGKKIMGHDGYMEVGTNLHIYADINSTKYSEKITNEIINTDEPIFSYVPGQDTDAVSSATEQYFADRGLVSTMRGGVKLDTTTLHLKEWLECIRNGGTPSCNIDEAFEEAMTAHMGTLSYRNQKQVFWDSANEEIII